MTSANIRWEERFYTPPPPGRDFETATVPELRQKLLYTTPSGWWFCTESVFRIFISTLEETTSLSFCICIYTYIYIYIYYVIMTMMMIIIIIIIIDRIIDRIIVMIVISSIWMCICNIRKPTVRGKPGDGFSWQVGGRTPGGYALVSGAPVRYSGEILAELRQNSGELLVKFRWKYANTNSGEILEERVKRFSWGAGFSWRGGGRTPGGPLLRSLTIRQR